MCALFALVVTACGASNTPTGDPVQLAEGKALYEQHCASCHGVNGEGQPNWKLPDADGIYPAPPHNNEGHTWHHPDHQLLAIIAEGGTMPNTQMPSFADTMTPEQMEATLAYIKTFWGEEERKFQEQVTRQFQTGD